jgi:hypothetical protein
MDNGVNMKGFAKYLMLFLFSLNACADGVLPKGLVKVNEKNNPNCVEYVIFRGEMYCSEKPFDKTPIDPKLVAAEKQKIVFDKRAWRPAWGKKTLDITTIEYIPLGQDINHWNELVTSQFIPEAKSLSPQDFAKRFIAGLSQLGLTYSLMTIIDQPDMYMFEFKISQPKHLQQDEIQKIVKGKDGLYVLHYAIKKSDMDAQNRKQWVDNLKNSKLLK